MDMLHDDPLGEDGPHRELAQEFARRLREARERQWPRLTQKAAAEQVGISERQYIRWEHGDQLPPFERIARIVEVTGVDISDLIEPAGSITRDGIKDYFDQRIEEITKLVQANQLLLQDAIEQLRVLNGTILERVDAVERRLSERGSL